MNKFRSTWESGQINIFHITFKKKVCKFANYFVNYLLAQKKFGLKKISHNKRMYIIVSEMKNSVNACQFSVSGKEKFVRHANPSY